MSMNKHWRRQLGLKKKKRLQRNNHHWVWPGDYILLKTRKPCSCYMCGNPRRHFGQKTRQELMADYEEL